MGIWLSPFEYLKRITGLYLESGFFEYFSIAPCNEATYRPARLYFNAFVTGGIKLSATTIDDPPYFQGQSAIDGMESIVVGPSQFSIPESKVNSITRCDVWYTSATLDWYDNEVIRRIKTIQTRIKPSNFSGKLRLFVQAIYGAKRHDYDSVDDYQALNYPLFFQGEQLHYTGTASTSGIFSTSDYRYFLLSVPNNTPSSILYVELIPAAGGEEFRQHLIAHDSFMSAEEIRQIEAYILADCHLSENSGTISVSGADNCVGYEVAYGWHFNWQGNEAHIILHRDNKPDDQAWHAYHFKLDFSLSGDTPTVTISTVFSDKKWYGVGNKVVLAPEYLTGNMIAMVNPANTPFSGWNIDSNWESEIYCYYDESDVLRMVKVGNVHSPAESVGAQTLPLCGVLSGDHIRTIAAFTRPKSNESFVEITGGGTMKFEFDTKKTVNNTAVEFFRYTGQTGFETPYPLQNLDPTGTLRRLPTATTTIQICGGTSLYDHGFSVGALTQPYNSTTSYTLEKVSYGGKDESVAVTYNNRNNTCHYYRKNNADQIKSVTHLVCIPFHDCGYAIIGEKSRDSESHTGLTQVWKNGRTTAECIYNRWIYPSGVRVLLATLGPYPMSAHRIFNQAVGTDHEPAATVDNYIVKFADHLSIFFEDAPSDSYEYSTYFDVDHVTDPMAYFQSAHMTSITGAKRNVISGLLDIDGGYIKDTSVGWA